MTFGNIIDKYRYVDDLEAFKPDVNRIWLMRWQGKTDLPSLIRVCYESIRKNFHSKIVTILTSKNYHEIVKILQHIEELFKSKKKIVNFSDILRVFHLMQRGCLWFAATMAALTKNTEDIFDYSLYTARFDV